MQSLHDVPAPAKLNLFLHITGRRSDGYHLLQSIFTLIDWEDTLHFDVRSDGQITREDLSWELPADDLTTRAARALQSVGQCPLGAHIGVLKSVPAQAGMGGGSSDAASTLLALNRLWGLHLPLKKLMEIGLQLGADVPFFLGGSNAWVEGIGDSEPAIISGFAADAFGQVFKYGRNDLQAVAQKLSPSVTQALEWLALQGLNGRMTGSGSAVFAHVPAERANETWKSVLPDSGLQVKFCSGLDVHPLSGWADSKGHMSV